VIFDFSNLVSFKNSYPDSCDGGQVKLRFQQQPKLSSII